MQTSSIQHRAFHVSDFTARLIRHAEAERLIVMLHALLRTPRLEAQSATAGQKFRTALFGFRTALHDGSIGFSPDAKRFLAREFGPATRFQLLTTGQANAFPKELLVLVDRVIAHLTVPVGQRAGLAA